MPTVCKRVWSLGLSAKSKREDERECWNAASGPKHDENAESQQNGWGNTEGSIAFSCLLEGECCGP